MPNKLPLVLFTALIAISACNKRPKGVLPENEMVQLMADMEVAEVYIQQNNHSFYDDNSRDRVVQWVLDKRGISKADFDSTMTWYGKNIDVYYALYAKVDAELTRREKKATGGQASDMNISGSDLWPYSKHILLSELSNSNSMKFSIATEDVEKGDRLNLKMRSKGFHSGSVLLGVDYDNGPTSYSFHNYNGDSRIDISLQTDSARPVKRIYGYIRSRNSKQAPVWLDSITLERLPIDSTQYYKIFSQRKSYAPIKRTEVKKDSVTSEGEQQRNSAEARRESPKYEYSKNSTSVKNAMVVDHKSNHKLTQLEQTK